MRGPVYKLGQYTCQGYLTRINAGLTLQPLPTWTV